MDTYQATAVRRRLTGNVDGGPDESVEVVPAEDLWAAIDAERARIVRWLRKRAEQKTDARHWSILAGAADELADMGVVRMGAHERYSRDALRAEWDEMPTGTYQGWLEAKVIALTRERAEVDQALRATRATATTARASSSPQSEVARAVELVPEESR